MTDYETGWVIERGISPVYAPEYWDGIAWTSDHAQALRFARQEDATRGEFWLPADFKTVHHYVAADGGEATLIETAVRHRVAEHMWFNQPRPRHVRLETV